MGDPTRQAQLVQYGERPDPAVGGTLMLQQQAALACGEQLVAAAHQQRERTTPDWASVPSELLAAILHPAHVGIEVRAACKSFRSAYDAGVQRATLHLLAPAVLCGELLPAPPPFAPVVRLDAAEARLCEARAGQTAVTMRSLVAALERWPVRVPLQLDLSQEKDFLSNLEDLDIAQLLRCPTFAPGGLQVLELGGSRLGRQGAQELAAVVPAAQQLSALRELGLNSCCIRGEGAIALCSALQAATHVSSLTRLDLDRNAMGSKGATALAACLCGAPHLTASLRRLVVCDNDLRDEGAAALASAVASCGMQLTHLDISSNMFGDRGATAWAAALRTSPHLAGLEVLDLTDYCMGSACIATLCESLQAATHLTRLRRLALLAARCGPEATARFAKLLRAAPHLAGIQELHLSFAGLSDSAAAAVAGVVLDAGSPLTQLRILRLDDCKIEVLHCMCAALPGAMHLRGLRELSLAQCLGHASGEQGIQALEAALAASPHLSELCRVPFGDLPSIRRPVRLSRMVEVAPHLRSLTSVKLQCTDEGCARGLGDVLKVLPHLRNLTLCLCDDLGIVRKVAAALQHAPGLEELHIPCQSNMHIAHALAVLKFSTCLSGLRRLHLLAYDLSSEDLAWLGDMIVTVA